MMTKTDFPRSPLTDYPNPARVRQLLAALEMGPADPAVLDYLAQFMNYIPVAGAYFLHVLPKVELYSQTYRAQAEDMVNRHRLGSGILTAMRQRVAESGIDQQTIDVQYDLRDGDPLEALLNEANDLQSDLLVIGQQTQKDEHGILARNLIRQASGNVLVVPDQARWRMRRIMVPIDFSAHSVTALRAAMALRKQLEDDTKVIAVNVYELPNLSVYKIQKTRAELDDMLREDRQLAFEAFLDEHLGDEAEQVERILIQKEVPGIAHYLMEYAGQHQVDFIVMGAQGHSTVERMFLGSVTEKMMNLNERLPILVVKQPSESAR